MKMKKSSEVLPETKEDTASQPETETVHETAHTAELQTRDNTRRISTTTARQPLRIMQREGIKTQPHS